MPEEHDPAGSAGETGVGDLLALVPGVVRVAVYASARVAAWATETSVRTGTEAARRALRGDPPARIAADVLAGVRASLDPWLTGPHTGGHAEPTEAAAPGDAARTAVTPEELRRRGAELLRRSSGVEDVAEGHPAYARILGDLVPDEARVLRFLLRDGPQPAVDVRTGRPFGIGSALVDGGLTMVAEHAGLRYADRIGPYLTNLSRLGLIAFSPEPVEDPGRYQLIEAQPKVAVVRARAGRAPRVVHRSVRLTDFGHDFCAMCFPPDA